MNITQLREDIRNLENELDAARQRSRQLVNDENASVADMTAQIETINKLMARLDLLRQDLRDAEAAGAQHVAQQATTQRAAQAANTDTRSTRLAQMLASNEYARAFAFAIRNGISVQNGRGDERLNVLYAALTESGSEGADGGFLVPEEINYQIREQRRQLLTLSSLFDVQTVSTNKGQYTKDIATESGFTKLDGEIPSGGMPSDDQPKFARVPYTLDTYGLNIPISNELVADEVAGLFNYLARFFARKHVLTENKLLLELLAQKEAVEVKEVYNNPRTAMKRLKGALNTLLDPAISLNASILTNQSGFDYLDQMEDEKGRPMLQPDPTSGTPMLFKSHRVVVASDKHLANPDEHNLPFYIGDFAQYGTLFMRQPLEIASTNIGGNAWRTNSTEVRGITRLGTAVFDEDAAVYMKMEISQGE